MLCWVSAAGDERTGSAINQNVRNIWFPFMGCFWHQVNLNKLDVLIQPAWRHAQKHALHGWAASSKLIKPVTAHRWARRISSGPQDVVVSLQWTHINIHRHSIRHAASEQSHLSFTLMFSIEDKKQEGICFLGTIHPDSSNTVKDRICCAKTITSHKTVSAL